MKNLKFKYIRAKNFLPFGPEGVELFLENYGNIVLIKGHNKDVSEDAEKSRNGVGKTSIPNILVYGLYGRTIHNDLNHDEVINNKSGSDLEVEIIWDDFRIIRQRKPNKLRFWESQDQLWDDTTEKTAGGGMKATQELIEIALGLSFDTFVNLVVFRDNNTGSFLECDTPAKRGIIEDILSLASYKDYCEKAKEHKKDVKNNIVVAEKEYSSLLAQLTMCDDRITKLVAQKSLWYSSKAKEIANLENAIIEKEKELKQTDIGQALATYNEAQRELVEVNDKITKTTENLGKIDKIKEKIAAKITEAQSNLDTAAKEFHSHELASASSTKIIKEEAARIGVLGQKQDGAKCPSCYGTVDKKNYQQVLDDAQNLIIKEQGKLDEIVKVRNNVAELVTKYKSEVEKFNNAKKEADANYRQFSQNIQTFNKRITELNRVNKPDIGSFETVLQARVLELTQQLEAKKTELSGATPYDEILIMSQKERSDKASECTNHKTKLDASHEEVPYYDFWVTAFGDTGIRKFIIDGILPALNSRIAYWMSYLIDGKIKLTFDNEFKEKIETHPYNGEPFVYANMSGGERRRLNLAVSQAFAYMRMLNCGVAPSLVFLDEVTTNIDPLGVENVFRMIVELSKNKQVFITTHDHDLLEMLSDYPSIYLVRENHWTKLQEVK